AVVQNQAALLNDKGTPSYGPADAKVTVVEFFDYQCIYCARLAPELEKVIKANPDVRFVFKEFPIFGQRWPASLSAAKTGLQIWK
ncbi:thioredoxin domain-containing protein, partial [Klebsiella pneumoniae]